MLQQHSQKVRMKSDAVGFLPDENPWTAPLSPEEEYAVLILVNTHHKNRDEAEYIVRGERLRRRPPKRDASDLVVKQGEVVELLGMYDRRQGREETNAEANLVGDAEVMVHVRNGEGIEAWTRQVNVGPLLPAS